MSKELDNSDTENEKLDKVGDRHKNTKLGSKKSVGKHIGKEKLFCCEQCGKVAKTKQALERHAAYHNTDRPFSCQMCGQRFKNSDDLGKHLRRLRRDNKYEHACKVCHKHFKSDTLLMKHVEMLGCERKTETADKVHSISDTEDDHEKVEKAVETEMKCFCKDCDKEFCSTDALKLHYKDVHQDSKRHVCRQCGQTLSSKDSLMRHYSIFHQNDFPFQCEQCLQKFKVKESLCRHVKFVHKDGGYTCDICQRIFSQPVNLKKHMAVHSISKEYHCEICNKEFRWKQSLQKHLLLHPESLKNRKSQLKRVKVEETGKSGTFLKAQILPTHDQDNESSDTCNLEQKFRSDKAEKLVNNIDEREQDYSNDNLEDVRLNKESTEPFQSVVDNFDEDTEDNSEVQNFKGQNSNNEVDRSPDLNSSDIRLSSFSGLVTKTENELKGKSKAFSENELKRTSKEFTEKELKRKSEEFTREQRANETEFVKKRKQDDRLLTESIESSTKLVNTSDANEDVIDLCRDSDMEAHKDSDKLNVDFLLDNFDNSDDETPEETEQISDSPDSSQDQDQISDGKLSPEETQHNFTRIASPISSESSRTGQYRNSRSWPSLAEAASSSSNSSSSTFRPSSIASVLTSTSVLSSNNSTLNHHGMLVTDQKSLSTSRFTQGTRSCRQGTSNFSQGTSNSSQGNLSQGNSSLSQGNSSLSQGTSNFSQGNSYSSQGNSSLSQGTSNFRQCTSNFSQGNSNYSSNIGTSSSDSSTGNSRPSGQAVGNVESSTEATTTIGKVAASRPKPAPSPSGIGKFSLIKHMLSLQNEEHFDKSVFDNPFKIKPCNMKSLQRIADMHKISNNPNNFSVNMKQNIPFQWLGVSIRKDQIRKTSQGNKDKEKCSNISSDVAMETSNSGDAVESRRRNGEGLKLTAAEMSRQQGFKTLSGGDRPLYDADNFSTADMPTCSGNRSFPLNTSSHYSGPFCNMTGLNRLDPVHSSTVHDQVTLNLNMTCLTRLDPVHCSSNEQDQVALNLTTVGNRNNNNNKNSATEQTSSQTGLAGFTHCSSESQTNTLPEFVGQQRQPDKPNMVNTKKFCGYQAMKSLVQYSQTNPDKQDGGNNQAFFALKNPFVTNSTPIPCSSTESCTNISAQSREEQECLYDSNQVFYAGKTSLNEIPARFDRSYSSPTSSRRKNTVQLSGSMSSPALTGSVCSSTLTGYMPSSTLTGSMFSPALTGSMSSSTEIGYISSPTVTGSLYPFPSTGSVSSSAVTGYMPLSTLPGSVFSPSGGQSSIQCPSASLSSPDCASSSLRFTALVSLASSLHQSTDSRSCYQTSMANTSTSSSHMSYNPLPTTCYVHPSPASALIPAEKVRNRTDAQGSVSGGQTGARGQIGTGGHIGTERKPMTTDLYDMSVLDILQSPDSGCTRFQKIDHLLDTCIK